MKYLRYFRLMDCYLVLLIALTLGIILIAQSVGASSQDLIVELQDTSGTNVTDATVTLTMSNDTSIKAIQQEDGTYYFQGVSGKVAIEIEHPQLRKALTEFALAPEQPLVRKTIVLGALSVQALQPLNSAPSNDQCEDRIPVEVPSLTEGTTINATIDDSFPYCGTSITSPGVWYSVIGTGNTMTASTCNDENSETGWADFDTKISVYCLSCIYPNCVAGLDDTDGCNNFSTLLSCCSQAGAEYLILVHGFDGATGNFGLSIYDDGVPCEPEVYCIPIGACCQCDGANQFCTIETEANCDALGGNYLGDDTECEGKIVIDSSPNISIPDKDASGASDTITMVQSFNVLDLDVDLTIAHTWVGDLCVTLSKDGGDPVELIRRPGLYPDDCGSGCCGCSADNYAEIILDDEGDGGPIEDACQNNLTSPPNYIPNNPLSFFDDMDSAGAWTLTVSDGAVGDVGTLVRWSLHFKDPEPGASACAEAFPNQCEIPGKLDIKPGSCPNSFKPMTKNVSFFPVALVGIQDIPADMVDFSSLQLKRADGEGSSVAPVNGPPGPKTVLDDVATPFDGELCDCHEMMGDGIMDVSMKFEIMAVVDAFGLGDMPDNALIELTLTGQLLDGTPFRANDCIRIVPAPENEQP